MNLRKNKLMKKEIQRPEIVFEFDVGVRSYDAVVFIVVVNL